MSEARAKLIGMKNTTRMDTVGLVGGVYTGFTSVDVRALEDSVVRYGLAQAKIDGIASTEEGLVVRDIIPDLDLRDGNGNAITKREWVQPVSGSYNTEEAEKEIYRTTTNSGNDRKIIIIYGVRETNNGPGRTASALNISALIFKRSTVKVIDIWHIESLDTMIEGVAYSRTPILFKKNDEARIYFYPKTGASGSGDNLILLGKVVEAIGNNVTG
jgi:hypothetical protein